jgi:hypothetical protein
MCSHPILDAGWTTGGRDVESTIQLDFTFILTIGELVRNSMKISDCEMQRIDKPTIYTLYSAFWNGYPAGYLLYSMYRRKRFIGRCQQN